MTSATYFTGGTVADQGRQPREPVERWADAPDGRRAATGDNEGAEQLGRVLGFFSLGLGLPLRLFGPWLGA